MQVQEEISMLKAQVKELQKQIVELRARAITSASRKQARASYVAASEFEIDSSTPAEIVVDNVKKLGRIFQLFHGLFIVPSAATFPRPVFSPTDKLRYATPENITRGIVSELYNFIPPAYHALIFNVVESTVGVTVLEKQHWTIVSIL